MCVDQLKNTRKPACTIDDVLAEIEPATAQIRHKKIRGSKMQRARRTERRRRGESKVRNEWRRRKFIAKYCYDCEKGLGCACGTHKEEKIFTQCWW
jgi:hypothetical protein